MQLTIDVKEHKPLLKRTEIRATCQFDQKTITKDEAKKKIVEAAKVAEGLLQIEHIYTQFGTHTATILAYVFDDEATMKLFMPKKKDKNPAGAPAEEKK